MAFERLPFYSQCNVFFSNSCDRPEQKVAIAVGTLQKQVKSTEERHMELEEGIRKKQEALKKSIEREVSLSNVIFHNLMKSRSELYVRNY